MIDARTWRQIRLTPQQHSFFDSFVTVLASAVGLQQALLAQLEGRALAYAPDDTMSLNGMPHVTGVKLYVQVGGILSLLANDQWPSEIVLFEKPPDAVLPPRPVNERVYQVTRGFKGLTDLMMRAAFINYYESRQPADHFGSDRSGWPQIWRFGAIVRNALTHNGRIDIRNPNSPPESWRTLTYGPSDNGKPLLFQDFAIPELLYLMIDMETAK